ncbi:S-adenosyl-L-methionine-dependent methyltransferase [Talaromyces proteolyticus]|uniref:tRNA wybutosine-synthesizing protein 2 n=1 Tax=Talaromyces proteolyticus TaxID=1131652 RepID=A0AAD4Q119_9EURO|nr:S-adenosyl-L-methionine-dependent methyltransferase [Talaromyces proteolyticus]KAH8705130.1 S-adenosyl-L-methionine-dependent methyltransferase [Talaromyces proteolyticus]
MNPLVEGIHRFLQNHILSTKISQSNISHHDTLIDGLPKRYTIYKPLLLLPVNVFTSPQPWAELYSSLDNSQRQLLYESIAASFSKSGVTHVALNAPIAVMNSVGTENRMRSPVGLVPLHGDFGPILDPDSTPDDRDFKEALWVQTVQNGGIVQCWAPLYTMFSRGNITEKARILGQGNRFAGLDESSLNGQDVGEISVVDLYAGIGYFVFSYLKRGVKRVWGWELNAWSVEGLRRGCLQNGWRCKVVPLNAQGELKGGYEDMVNEITDDDRIIIFHGDNRLAAQILGNIQPLLEEKGSWAAIRHVNQGLLPTSQPTWETSLRILDRDAGGWAHVHENVDVNEIDMKSAEIVQEYERFGYMKAVNMTIACDYVERVKTYAPGVMHCVYDIHVEFDKQTWPYK